jgi:acetolactate synthase I/II/III large subunit
MSLHTRLAEVGAAAESRVLTGAESLLRTLVGSGVDVCFANPGTSEMHFVDALDRVDGMRCVLGLFEGTVTGAADGYARMLDRPACTLLHLGPGLANGLSNLHNAMRAQSPVVNVIGDHATHHRHYDAPLTSDIEGTARPFSHWVRTSPNAGSVAVDGAAAVAAALSAPGRIASLILPADAAWSTVSAEPAEGHSPVMLSPASRPSEEAVEAARRMLASGEPTAIILAGRATREVQLEFAGKIAAVSGARLFAQTHTPRISRGAGRVEVMRIPYPIDQAISMLMEFSNIVLVGAKPPTAFFAYPDKPSLLFQPGTRIHELVRADQDIVYALEALTEALGATAVRPPVAPAGTSDGPASGPLTPASIGTALGESLPEQAIVVDESITTGRTFLADTRTSAPHDWILPTGGSIGYALPNAIGAAIACPDRKVVVLESDGSGLYSPQSLWTIAHENLNVVVLVFANSRYQILRHEMANVGASGAGPKASSLFDLTNPVIDWVRLATGLGVEACRAQTLEELRTALAAAYAKTGPTLIEVVL